MIITLDTPCNLKCLSHIGYQCTLITKTAACCFEKVLFEISNNAELPNIGNTPCDLYSEAAIFDKFMLSKKSIKLESISSDVAIPNV